MKKFNQKQRENKNTNEKSTQKTQRLKNEKSKSVCNAIHTFFEIELFESIDAWVQYGINSTNPNTNDIGFWTPTTIRLLA